jgi:hypothetical protein
MGGVLRGPHPLLFGDFRRAMLARHRGMRPQQKPRASGSWSMLSGAAHVRPTPVNVTQERESSSLYYHTCQEASMECMECKRRALMLSATVRGLLALSDWRAEGPVHCESHVWSHRGSHVQGSLRPRHGLVCDEHVRRGHGPAGRLLRDRLRRAVGLRRRRHCRPRGRGHGANPPPPASLLHRPPTGVPTTAITFAKRVLGVVLRARWVTFVCAHSPARAAGLPPQSPDGLLCCRRAADTQSC